MYRKARSDGSIFSVESTLNIIILVLLIAVIIYIIWKDFVSKDKVDLKKLKTDVDTLLKDKENTAGSLKQTHDELRTYIDQEMTKSMSTQKMVTVGNAGDEITTKVNNTKVITKVNNTNNGADAEAEKKAEEEKKEAAKKAEEEKKAKAEEEKKAKAEAAKKAEEEKKEAEKKAAIMYLNDTSNNTIVSDVLGLDVSKTIQDLGTILGSAKTIKKFLDNTITMDKTIITEDPGLLNLPNTTSSDTRKIEDVLSAKVELVEMDKLKGELRGLVKGINTWLSDSNTKMNPSGGVSFSVPDEFDLTGLKAKKAEIEKLTKGKETDRKTFITRIDDLIDKIEAFNNITHPPTGTPTTLTTTPTGAPWTELWNSSGPTTGPIFSPAPDTDAQFDVLTSSYDDDVKDHDEIRNVFDTLVKFKNEIAALKAPKPT